MEGLLLNVLVGAVLTAALDKELGCTVRIGDGIEENETVGM